MVNYGLAIVDNHQVELLDGQGHPVRILAWTIGSTTGNSSSYLNQVDFQPLPAKVVAQSVKQITEDPVVTLASGTGNRALDPTPISREVSRLSLRRPADTKGVWRWAGRMPTVVPLVGLGFVLCVLAVKAWPAIRVNGTGFFTSSEWNPGRLRGHRHVPRGQDPPGRPAPGHGP